MIAYSARVACLCLSLLSLAGGCCRPRFDFGPSPRDDAGEVLALAEALLASPPALEGEARLRFRLPQGRFGADHLVVVVPPDRLRLDTLGFFGSPLAVLLVRDGELLLWDIDGGRAYRGPATQGALSEILPLALSPEQVISLLLGRPPLPAQSRARARLVQDREARAYRVDLRGEGELQRRWFDPESGALLRVRAERAGEAPWEVRYEDYRPVGDAPGLLPWKVAYERGQSGLLFRWRSLRVEPSIDEGIFDLALPPGIPTVPIGGPVRWLPPEAPEGP